ncbi:MAG: flagellin, partial [Campylobacterota bacterium]
DTGGTAAASATVPTAGNTVSDLLDEIENQFGDVEARISDSGQIKITDNTQAGNFTLNMETQDGGGTAVEGFQNSYTSMQTAGFEKKDNTLTSNVAQVINANNEFATESTKLSEVASNGDIEGTTFDLDYTDIGGTDRSARIDFDAGGVKVQDDSGATIFSVLSHDGSNTSPNDMTYKQLQDAIGMLVTDNIPADNDRAEYLSNSKTAENQADVFINDSGQLSIKDKTTTDTQMRFSMYQNDQYDFSGTPKEGSKLSFMSNNALTVDDVHVDMFKVLDDAIEAVENGFQRPDGSKDEMSRSVGIQNLLDQVDHIHDHTVRKHTEIGAVSQSFDYQISRNETLEVHTQTLRSETIDVDYGEAAMKLQQLQLNYQAMASSVARVQQLSLVNYL